MKKTLLASIFLLLCCISASAQTEKSNTKRFRVDISVDSPDKQTADEVQSYLAREIRSLGDVDIAPVIGNFSISIIVLKAKSQGGPIGYAVSSSFLENIYSRGDKKFYTLYRTGSLDTGGMDDLRKICEGIVTDFDIRVLAERR